MMCTKAAESEVRRAWRPGANAKQLASKLSTFKKSANSKPFAVKNRRSFETGFASQYNLGDVRYISNGSQTATSLNEMKEKFLKMIWLWCSWMALENNLGTRFRREAVFKARPLTTEIPLSRTRCHCPLSRPLSRGEWRGYARNGVSVHIAKPLALRLGVRNRHQAVILTRRGKTADGLGGNLEFGAKFQFLKKREHETITSLASMRKLGGTGNDACRSGRPLAMDTHSLLMQRQWGRFAMTMSIVP